MPQGAGATTLVPAATLPRRRTYVAVMSGVVRRGAWLVPKRINALAWTGGIELDLREATLDPGVTEIRVLAIMGGVVVTVPPNVRLDCDGFAFMSGFENQLKQPASGDPTARVVRLTGFALMGGVEARVLQPGAPPDEEYDRGEGYAPLDGCERRAAAAARLSLLPTSGPRRRLLRSPEGRVHRPRFRRDVALHRIDSKAL